jgi:hypothetical protein
LQEVVCFYRDASQDCMIKGEYFVKLLVKNQNIELKDLTLLLQATPCLLQNLDC